MLGLEGTEGCGCVEIKGDAEERYTEEELVICAGPHSSPQPYVASEAGLVCLEN